MVVARVVGDKEFESVADGCDTLWHNNWPLCNSFGSEVFPHRQYDDADWIAELLWT
jgi:hypothetical protein